MSWQYGLIVAAVLYILVIGWLSWLSKPKQPFISNAELNRERITVDFRVGRDCK